MMNILDEIELDDNNNYVVVSKTTMDNKICYYIVDKIDNSNYKICYEDNNDLVEIIDINIIKRLLPLFLESSKDELISVVG